MKRALILLLVLLMCTTAFFGCKKSGEDETSTPTVNTSDVLGVEELGNHNFGGADFTILTRSETSYEHIGDLGGDSVSQAVYQRNLVVSERFGVNIKTVDITGGYDNRSDFVTALRAEHMTSTGAYDLVSTHSVYLGWLGSEGILADLSALPSVDLTKEYWNQNLYNELNVDGSCYIMIGDIGHTLYEYMSVMFVNTDILAQNNFVEGGIDGLYNMVDAGAWTWEQLYTMSRSYGNGAEDSKYGLLFNTHAMRAAMISQDAGIYKRGEDGRFKLELAANEHLINAVNNLSRLFAQPNMYFANGWGTEETELNPMFTQGTALFYGQTLGQSAKFATDMGEGYAVLPLPKYDEFQSDYYTICRDTVTAVAVMENTKNKEMSGVVTQALALYGSQYVTPEYYEKALKYRYAADPRCPEILEKIRASLTIEAPPTFYETGIDSDMFKDIIMSGSNVGVASKYESYVSQGNGELKNFYTQIDFLRG